MPRARRFAANPDRHAPTLLKATGQATSFHDERAGRVAQMLTAVLTSPQAFGSRCAGVRARPDSRPEFRRWFSRAFGPGVRMEPATMAAALTAYLNPLRRLDLPYDRAQQGSEAVGQRNRIKALSLTQGITHTVKFYGSLHLLDAQITRYDDLYVDGRLVCRLRFSNSLSNPWIKCATR